jgi:hypothetical protein
MLADILFTWCINESSPTLLSCLMSWPLSANPQTLSNRDPHIVWWLVTNCSCLAGNVAHFPRPIIVSNTIQWVICEISKGQVLGFCVAEQAIVRIQESGVGGLPNAFVKRSAFLAPYSYAVWVEYPRLFWHVCWDIVRHLTCIWFMFVFCFVCELCYRPQVFAVTVITYIILFSCLCDDDTWRWVDLLKWHSGIWQSYKWYGLLRCDTV